MLRGDGANWRIEVAVVGVVVTAGVLSALPALRGFAGSTGFFGFPGSIGAAGSPSGFGPPGGGRAIELPVWWDLALVALIVVSAGILALRLRWPVFVLGAALISFFVASGLGWPTLGPMLALAIAAYSLASHSERIVTAVTVGVSAGWILVISFAVTNWQSSDPRLLQAAAAAAIAGALGDSARSRRELLDAATARARRAEETREAEASRRVSEERLRIARDLHDTVAHQISVISLNAGVASSALRTRPERAESALSTIRSSARGALSEIGELLRHLRSEEIAASGESAAHAIDAVPDAPQPGIARVTALVNDLRAGGLKVHSAIIGAASSVPDAVGVATYRIVQEGLANAQKHGADGPVECSIDISASQVSVRIANAVPTEPRRDAHSAPAWSGYGLVGIRERAAALGGSVAAGPVNGAEADDVEGERYVLEVRLPAQGAHA